MIKLASRYLKKTKTKQLSYKLRKNTIWETIKQKTKKYLPLRRILVHFKSTELIVQRPYNGGVDAAT